MKRIAFISIAVIAAVTAQAQTLNFNGMVSNKSSAVKIKYNGKYMNVSAGAMSVNLDGGTNFEAYCVDLDHWNRAGKSYDVSVDGLSTVNNSAIVENLWENFSSDVNSKYKGAAFQLALWDAVVDGGDGINTGNFKAYVNNTIANQVATYQAGYNTPGQVDFDFRVFNALDHGRGDCYNQDLMTGDPVPEPATLLGLGAFVVAAVRRRRKSA